MGILTWIYLIPFLAAMIIVFTPPEKLRFIKWVALSATSVVLTLAIGLVVLYLQRIGGIHGSELMSGTRTELMFVERVAWFKALGIEYFIGVDGISVAMICLTAIVIFCGVLVSWGVTNRAKEFFAFLLVLVTGVFGVFMSFDLFLLFLFYEVAVLPMYLLIGIWGTGPKEYSAMKLTLMLMAGSAFILVGILAMFYYGGLHSFNMIDLAQVQIPKEAQAWVFPMLFVGFGILGALFPFHTWSPDGHASAPTAVSMLHAGVLMKLGGYGCLRTVYMLPEGAHAWAYFFMVLTTINITYGAFVAIQKKDLKYITAYSSVSHCGFVLFGLLALTATGLQGSVLQSFSHGIMTALFFGLIGMIYGRTHTRMIDEMGGIIKVMPFLGVAYYIAGFASLGLPGFSGFIAEVTVFVGAFSIDDLSVRILTVIATMSIVVTAVYILRALGRMFFGPIQNPEHAKLTDAVYWEKIPVGVLVFVLAFIGMFPGWLVRLIEYSLGPIMNNLSRQIM